MNQKTEKRKPIENHWELEVYQLAFDAAMKIYQLSKQFPIPEGLYHQITTRGTIFTHPSLKISFPFSLLQYR